MSKTGLFFISATLFADKQAEMKQKTGLRTPNHRNTVVVTLQKRCKIMAWCINQHKLYARRAGVATLFARNQI